MTWLINIGAMILAFLLMEFVAWFAHKFVMHGGLWTLHQDHHKKDHGGVFERNDAFFLIFATPAITLFFFGVRNGIADVRIWIAAGITLYGLAYFLV
ncbi:MAG TPA: beta-carotene hydroxylase, partial [Flavobacteriales bacterium]|nr:beta-carotene hydroxylase [Flavobacteriales bacterium]